MDRFPGCYAGVVVDNDDPKGLCRIKVKVPEVLGEERTGWALPCLPYAGDGIGLAVVPPVDSVVFVEWPAGDVTRAPLWRGAAWADGTGVPEAGPDRMILLTPAGNRVEVDDTSGEESIRLETPGGALVRLDPGGVTLSFGSQKIALTSGSVSINDGALEVT
jgi:uncharacterized protein involved in type VI secretion and phage assembly